MEWFTENWVWVVGGLFVLCLIYRFTRPSNVKRTPATSTRKGNKQLTSAEQEKLLALLVTKLAEVMENEVDDVVGRHYNRHDRKKIAMGMFAVMATDKVSIDQLFNDRALFAAIMLRSIATLTAMGEISAR